MERESFENEEIARLLNKQFVAIKVDGDKIYMTAYQAMYRGGGGWPLNMFLTPDLKAFAGGAYFPPTDRQGRPGFLRILKTLAEAWSEKGDEVLKRANVKLAAITGREDFRKVGERTLHGASQAIKRSAYALPEMMSVAEMELGDQPKIVIVGEKVTTEFTKVCFQIYRPDLLLSGSGGKVDVFSLSLKPKEGKVTAYYCVGKTCRPPVTSADERRKMLEKKD